MFYLPHPHPGVPCDKWPRGGGDVGTSPQRKCPTVEPQRQGSEMSIRAPGPAGWPAPPRPNPIQLHPNSGAPSGAEGRLLSLHY